MVRSHWCGNFYSKCTFCCLLLLLSSVLYLHSRKITPMWTDEFLYLLHPVSFQYFCLFLFHLFFSVCSFPPPPPPLIPSCGWHSSTCSGLTVHTATYPLHKPVQQTAKEKCIPFLFACLANSVRRPGNTHTQVSADVCVRSAYTLSASGPELAAGGVWKCELAVESRSTVTVCLK